MGDPALGKANCDIEVYRLERVPADVRVAAEEAVLCRVPGWHFDFAAIEDLHRQFEDLRIEHERLKVQHSRTKEALVALNTALEADEQKELSRNDTKAAVKAFWSEFTSIWSELSPHLLCRNASLKCSQQPKTAQPRLRVEPLDPPELSGGSCSTTAPTPTMRRAAHGSTSKEFATARLAARPRVLHHRSST